MLNTKQKGLIAEHRLKEFFLKEGYDILNPEGDYLPFDFVIYKDSCFSRVQAKYISLSPTGVMSLAISAVVTDNRIVHKGIQLSIIDIIGIYCPETDKCYFIKSANIDSNLTALSLRVTDTKNGQLKNINWASDYEALDKQITVIKTCPYCNTYENDNWHSIRNHAAKCISNTGIYYIDLSIGPIASSAIEGITTQKQLNEKFPTIEGHLTNIKKSFNRKLTRV